MAIGPRPIIDITGRNQGMVPSWRRDGNQFIVVHYLGVDGQNPDLYCQGPGDCGYGGHFNIFWDGSIYEAADPERATVWHCGGDRQGYDPGSGTFFGICTNFNSIGIECSVHNDGTWFFTTETQESLVWLVSYLMDKYGIPIDHVIRHWDVTGKHCPAPYVENTGYKTNWTWDQFKQKLADYRSGKGDEDRVIAEIMKNARMKDGTNKYVTKYVNVDSGSSLNVRLAPAVNAEKHSYWPKLSRGNAVQQIMKFTNGWSLIMIWGGAGTGTVGYVKSSYLSSKKV